VIGMGKFRILSVILLAGLAGGVVGHLTSVPTVHANEYFSGVTNCVTVVPKSWGDFKGGSEYGLAFEDDQGVVRFVLHPGCGDVNSPAAPPIAPIDLEVQRR
jgi:hypothetical protein